MIDPPDTTNASLCLSAAALDTDKNNMIWFWVYIVFSVLYNLLNFGGVLH